MASALGKAFLPIHPQTPPETQALGRVNSHQFYHVGVFLVFIGVGEQYDLLEAGAEALISPLAIPSFIGVLV